MTQEERFTNRHGRKFETSELMGSVKLDNDPERLVTNTHVARATKDRRRRTARLPKWFKPFLIVVLFLLVGAPLLTGEYLTADYNKSARDSIEKVKVLAKNSVQTEKSSKKLRLEDLNTVVTNITTIRDDMCKGGFFDNLAKLYPRAKDALVNCTVSREKVVALSRELSSLQQTLAYAEELENIIRPLTLVPENEQFANLSSQQENWKTAHEQLKQLSPRTALKAVHEETVSVAGEIVKSWTALIEANNDRNVTNFQASEESLAKQYEQFRTMSGKYIEVANSTQIQISKNYSRLEH